MSDNRQFEPVKTTHRMRRVIIYAAVLVLAFLIGLVPMWWSGRQCSSGLAAAQRQLTLVRMQSSLGSAAIDARRGNYEASRQAASDFYTILRTETSKGVDSALSQAQIASLQPLLDERDQLITLLARGDVASADLLSDLYVSYRAIVNP